MKLSQTLSALLPLVCFLISAPIPLKSEDLGSKIQRYRGEADSDFSRAAESLAKAKTSQGEDQKFYSDFADRFRRCGELRLKMVEALTHNDQKSFYAAREEHKEISEKLPILNEQYQLKSDQENRSVKDVVQKWRGDVNGFRNKAEKFFQVAREKNDEESKAAKDLGECYEKAANAKDEMAKSYELQDKIAIDEATQKYLALIPGRNTAWDNFNRAGTHKVPDAPSKPKEAKPVVIQSQDDLKKWLND